MKKLVKLYLAEGDQWLLESVEKIVRTKRAAGMQSSVSFELVRLAKNGLIKSVCGGEADRAILLKEKKHDPE